MVAIGLAETEIITWIKEINSVNGQFYFNSSVTQGTNVLFNKAVAHIIKSFVFQTASGWLLFNANSTIFQLHCILWLEQVNFQWNDDEVCFVLDQHAYSVVGFL